MTLPPRRSLRALALALALAAPLGCSGGSGGSDGGAGLEADGPIRVLVFSRTEGFRHRSIDEAKLLFSDPSRMPGLDVTLSEEAADFRDEVLAGFDVVVFANTTGDVLDRPQEEALERFVRAGGGWVGVHSAADTEYDWPWYGRLVGAYFKNHPPVPFTLEVDVEELDHPSTAHLEPVFEWQDEWYNFDRNPREDHNVLLSIPPLIGFVDGPDHPIAWYKEFEGGRAWYTGLGHRPEAWENPLFVEHVLGGIRWAAAPVAWNRIVLSTLPRNPVALDVAPDGRLFYAELEGDVRAWSPETGRTQTVLSLEVDRASENGLLGLVLDPDFGRNGWLYVYHSTPTGEHDHVTNHLERPGPPGRNVLSRFTVDRDGRADPASRLDLLSIPSERECCHEGGGLDFGPGGLLYLSVGDNTDPFDNGGLAPLDNRPGRERYDARRTAGNPFDPRGKILRIRPDGSIPPGNLFPPDGSRGLPRIYVMGTRNPFRITIDPETGELYWGDVGPDAAFDTRLGPRGYDEFNRTSRPGHFGWPYCIADNAPYAERDLLSGTSGPAYDCSGFEPAWLAYDYVTRIYRALGDNSTARSDKAGRTAIAGAFYRASRRAPFRLPEPFADRLLISEWTRDIIAAVLTNPDGTVRDLRRLLPEQPFIAPIDFEVGPDGALYVLEYGSGLGSDNPDARLNRVEYSEAGRLTPVARLAAEPHAGAAPLTVELSDAGSVAIGRDDAVLRYEWDVDGDGVVDGEGPRFSHTYTESGVYPATLRVVGRSGRTSFPAVVEIVVGNSPPVVEIETPAEGEPLREGSLFVASGRIEDAEDPEIDCGAVRWDVRLGHNSHSHPIEQATGCTAELAATFGGHEESGELFYVLEMSYTDRGGPGGEPPLTARDVVRVPIEGGDGPAGFCTEDETTGIEECVESCRDSTGVELVSCFVGSCGGELGSIGRSCQTCLIDALPGVIAIGLDDIDELRDYLLGSCAADPGA